MISIQSVLLCIQGRYFISMCFVSGNHPPTFKSRTRCSMNWDTNTKNPQNWVLRHRHTDIRQYWYTEILIAKTTPWIIDLIWELLLSGHCGGLARDFSVSCLCSDLPVEIKQFSRQHSMAPNQRFFPPHALRETGWGADSDNRPREKHVLPKRRIFKRLELLSRRSDIWSKQLWNSNQTWSAQSWRDKKY